MEIRTLPEPDEMMQAFLERDPAYEGIFVTGVKTTGIFCRPTCPARKPLPENVEFFGTPREALDAGYRPCRRCEPLSDPGTTPEWIRDLLERVEDEPTRRWRDRDLRRMGLDPARVRRWFKRHHGMSFHDYSRSRRLGKALGRIRSGEEVSRAAFAVGFDSLSGFNEAFRNWMGAAPTETDAPLCTVTRVPTPLGQMVAASLEGRIVLLEFADRRMLRTQFATVRECTGCAFAPGSDDALERLGEWLEVYFDGRTPPPPPPLHTPGTEFQERVWKELRRIPRGEAISYGELAERIDRPSAVRAVGRANGQNRVALLVPCHRVVGADGSLTGYGGGLWRKRALLELEGYGGPA